MSLKSIERIENIILFPGTVFNANADAIVNTVNCMGVMGAGIALEFKLRYPEMYEDYVVRCKNNRVKIGEPYLYIAKDGTKIVIFRQNIIGDILQKLSGLRWDLSILFSITKSGR